MMERKQGGLITVFFSLILLLILSFFMTLIEGARIKTGSIYADRMVHTSMDSLLAEFYAPLLDEYHLLGMDAGFGTKKISEDTMVTKLQEYMSYSIDPNKDITTSSPGVDLLEVSLDQVMMKNRTGIMDYSGEIFIHQSVEYMKYKEIANGIELLLDHFSLLDTPKKVSLLYEEKSKVEEELIEIDEGILSLMKLLDGISTDKKGLKVNKDGSLKIESKFAKKMVIGGASRDKVGINHDYVYQALSNHYVDPMVWLNEMDASMVQLGELGYEIQEVTSDISNINHDLDQLRIGMDNLQDQLSEAIRVKESKEYISGIIAEINRCEARAQSHKDEIDRKNELIKKLTTELKNCKKRIVQNSEELHSLFESVSSKMTESIKVIQEIQVKMKTAEPLIKGYEFLLDSFKDELDGGIASGLEEGLKELKRYSSDSVTGYNFEEMLIQLDSNNIKAKSGITLASEIKNHMSDEEYSTGKSKIATLASILTNYQIENIKLDYSSFVFQKSVDQELLDSFRSLIDTELMSLVIDRDTLSKKEITNQDLPSILYALGNSTDTGSFNFIDFFKKIAKDIKGSDMGDIFRSFGNFDFSEMAVDKINETAAHILFWTYLLDHFDTYESDTNATRKPSALLYEQEYLITGNINDKENISSIITKLILMRTMMNFTSLIGDKAKWSEARTYAAALVGFTGLPILVAITQTIIMIILAFAESLVDVSALFMGKEVELIKKKVNYNVSEILTLSSSFIKVKAESYPDNPEGITFSYQDYLKLFLFLQKKEKTSYRAMDLIQENLRLRYDEQFTLSNCLYGFEVESTFQIQPKFLSFQFIQKHLNSYNPTNYKVIVAQSY